MSVRQIVHQLDSDDFMAVLHSAIATKTATIIAEATEIRFKILFSDKYIFKSDKSVNTKLVIVYPH